MLYRLQYYAADPVWHHALLYPRYGVLAFTFNSSLVTEIIPSTYLSLTGLVPGPAAALQQDPTVGPQSIFNSIL